MQYAKERKRESNSCPSLLRQDNTSEVTLSQTHRVNVSFLLMILCLLSALLGPVMRAFQFYSQTLVGPLLSVWSDLTGTDDLREPSPRYDKPSSPLVPKWFNPSQRLPQSLFYGATGSILLKSIAGLPLQYFVLSRQQLGGTLLHCWLERGIVRVKRLIQERKTITPTSAGTWLARVPGANY